MSTFEMNKKELKKLKKIIAREGVNEPIMLLLELLENDRDAELFNSLTLLSLDNQKLEKEELKFGATEDTGRRSGKIADRLLSIIDSLITRIKSTDTFENKKVKVIEEVEESGLELSVENKIDYSINEIEELYLLLNSRDPKYKWLEELEVFFEKIKEKWKNRRFQVAVMALMKSGKSTLLNSWIGNEYLPSNTIPETMQIIRIRHNEEEPQGILIKNEKIIAKGVSNIKEQIQKANKEERKSLHYSLKNELRLEVNLASLNGKSLNGYGFDFLDTPGVNEQGVPTLEGRVEQIIKGSDVIIYLLDYTKLNTAGEHEMFKSLKEWKIDILDQLKNRLFFVVNKIDDSNRHDRQNDMTPEKIQDYVKKILDETLEIKINRDSILLVSAEQALLSRLVEKDIASDEQYKDFKKIAFGAYGAKKKTNEDCKTAIKDILDLSGFSELENEVLNTIYEKRTQILVSAIVDNTKNNLSQIINNLEVGKGALQVEIESIKEIKDQISDISKEIDFIQKKSDKFKKKALNLVKEKFNGFKKQVRQLTQKAFSETIGSHNKFVWNKPFTEIYEIKGNRWEVVSSKMGQINLLVYNYIHNSCHSLWTEIAEDQHDDFMKFREEVEEKSKPLVQKIENVINEALNIELKPQKILFEQPSLENLYEGMQEYIHDITDVWEQSNMGPWESLFNKIKQFFGYGKEEIFHEEFVIRSDKYEDMVVEQFEPFLSEIEDEIQKFITIKYLSTVAIAKENINHYSEKYIQIMENEISTREKGVVDISSRIDNMNDDVFAVGNILTKIDSIFTKQM